MDEVNLGATLVSSLVTGIVASVLSTVMTTIALKVHIEYIRQELARHDRAITRAHSRIDSLGRKTDMSGDDS